MNAKQCYDIIQTHITQESVERDEWDEWTRWYHSEAFDRPARGGASSIVLSKREGEDLDEAVNVETNYTFAFIDTMTANVCPANPQVTVSAAHDRNRQYAKARERLANSILRIDDCGGKAREFATYAGLCGRAVTKVVWNASLARPEASNIDPRRFFWDRTVPFEKSRYACEVTLVTEDEFKARMKRGRKNGPRYNKEVAESANFGNRPEWFVEEEGRKISENFRWAVIYEFWDFVAGKYFHFLEGKDVPLLEGPLPFTYVRNPFVLKVFNISTRDSGGISDVKLIASHQEQLNEINSLELQHALKSIPAIIVDTSKVDSPEDFMDALQAINRPGGIVEAKVSTNTRNPAELFASVPTPGLIPSFSTMRNVAREGIAFTLGMSDYQRGLASGSDLATELSLINQSLQTRNGRRVKEMGKWVVEVAHRYINLYRQFIDPLAEIPVFDATGSVSEVLDYDRLGFSEASTMSQVEQEWWFTFEVVPFDPAENNRIVQLRSIQQFFPFLANNPNVDQAKLVTKLLDLLGMEDLVQIQQPSMAMPQQPVAAFGGGMNQPTVDNVGAGGAPAGIVDESQNIPPQPTADQPKVG